METGSEPNLNESIASARHLLQLLSDNESTQVVLDFLANVPKIPLWLQEEGTGWGVLHFAALREDPSLVKAFIDAGAVWNLVDHLGYTAGDVALSLNNSECYQLILDAGLRSELILHLLNDRSDGEVMDTQEGSVLILKAEDSTPAGSNSAFLEAKLTFKKDHDGQDMCIVNSGSDEIGVMLQWEQPIMEETVRVLHQDNDDDADFRVLNCGFGLGIIDTLFQNWVTCPPSLHVIIEPHPDVLAHMRATGWYSRPNVRILEGKWQDFVDSDELLGIGGFDAIYTDVFSESYRDLYEFFESVPNLLRGPNSTFSFFNGLGATNPVFYDVYTNLAEIHLKEMGLSVSWTDVDVHAAQRDGVWGQTRKYFSLPVCRVPLVKMDI